MAKIDDLIKQVTDVQIRRDLAAAVGELRKKKRFGLVYENHLPEMTALPGFPIQEGAFVVRRDKLSARHVFRVCALTEGLAIVEPVSGGQTQSVPVGELMAMQRFGEPIYPGLEKVGSTERGGLERPHHAVINAENYHAAQLLLHLYEGQVDCLYLDPPYNTGARDWTYNNDYVDSKDSFRHSKWLSFMEKRLRLAKRLLRPDGVLIITIDEHEVHHLGMLLEETGLFKDAIRQMITIVINPKGVTQGRFSRVDEYAFFVFMSDISVVGRGDDLLTPGIDEEEVLQTETVRRPRWKGLLRSGTNSTRKDRKMMFYPVLIDTQRGAVLGAGDYLAYEEQPDFASKINGLQPVWPVRTDGTLGNWGVGPSTLRKLIDKGYVSVGGYDSKRKTWAISYLSQEPQEQILSGVLEVTAHDQQRNVVDASYTDIANRRMKTVWHRTRHDAGTGGSDIIQSIFGSRAFAFPKSLYAVKDCLSAVVRLRPNALIVDFFAGSGTTFHATCLLNAEDGGQRRCILVTNNDVKEEQARTLGKEGYYKGDAEFEEHGIFEAVTRPRCEAVVTGHRADGTPVPGTHIGGRPLAEGFEENVTFFRLNYLDHDRVDMGGQFAAIAPLLWLESGGFGPYEPDADRREPGYSLPLGAKYAVLFREARIEMFLLALAQRPEITHVSLVTNREDAYTQMRAVLPSHIHTRRLYRDYLRCFRLTEPKSSEGAI